jgi:hypothetical protein
MLASAAHAATLCDNFNTNTVRNKPANQGTPCKITQTANITQIRTYHWNGGAGAPPGSVSLVNAVTGAKWGPFQTTSSSGQASARSVNWQANVQINGLPAGEYYVTDSGADTWSWNSQSAGYGFAMVSGEYTGGGAWGSSSSSPAGCPSGPKDKGLAIGPQNCPCNYPVGWGTSTVNTTNPGLKNWYPSCKPPLQCLGNVAGQSAFGNSSCR